MELIDYLLESARRDHEDYMIKLADRKEQPEKEEFCWDKEYFENSRAYADY